MRARFWGVRGSFPVAAQQAMRYGGNTSCVEICAGDRVVVIDAGTGIRGLGRDLQARGVRHVDLLLSHMHWDHIQGFPHFALLADAGATVVVHGLGHRDRSLADLLGAQQRQPFYPVGLEQARARLDFVEHGDGDTFPLGELQVSCRRLNHPGVTGGFRLEAENRCLAYICDTDLNGERLHAADLPPGDDAGWLERLRQGARDLGHGADLLVCDTFFRADEYDPTWGHSRVEDFVEFGPQVEADAMCLYHHRPERDDDELDALVAELSAGDGCRIVGAREGLEIDL